MRLENNRNKDQPYDTGAGSLVSSHLLKTCIRWIGNAKLLLGLLDGVVEWTWCSGMDKAYYHVMSIDRLWIHDNPDQDKVEEETLKMI